VTVPNKVRVTKRCHVGYAIQRHAILVRTTLGVSYLFLQSTEKIGRGSDSQPRMYASGDIMLATYDGPRTTDNSPNTALIHILDDDSLFKSLSAIFLGQNGHDDGISVEGKRDGSPEGGGINGHIFVNDGETSYSCFHLPGYLPRL
jgi:hypothetical protein